MEHLGDGAEQNLDTRFRLLQIWHLEAYACTFDHAGFAMAAVSQGAVMTELDSAQDPADLYLSFAEELADLVRPVVLSYFRTPLEVIAKLDQSPVTIADRAVERHLRERIEARFPTHGILGEE